MKIIFSICILILISTNSFAKKYDILESGDDFLIIDTGFEQLNQTQNLSNYQKIADEYCSNLRKNSFQVVKEFKSFLNKDIIRNYDQSYNIIKFKGRIRFFCISDGKFQTYKDMQMVNAMKLFAKYDKLMRKTFKSSVSQKSVMNKVGQKGDYNFLFKKRVISAKELKEREIAKKKKEQKLAIKRQQEIQRKRNSQVQLEKRKIINPIINNNKESSFSFKNTLGKMLGK